MSRAPTFLRRHLALIWLALLAVSASAEPAPPVEQELDDLIVLLEGEFVGSAPKGMTPEGETHQLVHQFRSASAPQLGERVMYYTVSSETAERPILQAKIFVFSSQPARTANTMYALVLTQAQAEKLREDGAPGWQELNRDALLSFPQECFFTWRRVHAGFLAEDSPTCSYESRAFKQRITPRMQYRISADAFQFEETLKGEDGKTIVSTGGLLKAARR